MPIAVISRLRAKRGDGRARATIMDQYYYVELSMVSRTGRVSKQFFKRQLLGSVVDEVCGICLPPRALVPPIFLFLASLLPFIQLSPPFRLASLTVRLPLFRITGLQGNIFTGYQVDRKPVGASPMLLLILYYQLHELAAAVSF